MWNVLQEEDEHRALSNADTKYGALTHIWALKTTQNEFKWQQNICKQRDVSHFRIALYGQVIHGRRYRWLISYMTPLSDGTPAHIRIYFIFLASRIIGLPFAANDIGLSSLKFFWWAPQDFSISKRGTFLPFKVIRGHWYWCQSKAHIWLPISP